MIGREKQPVEKEKEMSRGGLGKKDQEKESLYRYFFFYRNPDPSNTPK
jgi:hypothetical protein